MLLESSTLSLRFVPSRFLLFLCNLGPMYYIEEINYFIVGHSQCCLLFFFCCNSAFCIETFGLFTITMIITGDDLAAVGREGSLGGSSVGAGGYREG